MRAEALTARRFQALSLTGGGFRGLFSACVLAELERAARRPIGRCFELTAGTSIGGLLALAVAFEVPMERVVALFCERGAEIFPTPPTGKFRRARAFVDSLRRPRFGSEVLREALVSLFGESTRLGDAKHAVLIPALNLTTGRPQVFKTPHHERYIRDLEFRAVDVALATSAAPTFFAPAKFNSTLYADGGLFANAPDLIAWHELAHFLSVPAEDAFMLSIGTTTSAYSVVESPKQHYGLAYWFQGADPRLPNILIASQQQLALQIVEHVLGQRFARIDVVPSHEQAPHLGLAIASEVAKTTLEAIGRKAATDFLGSARASGFVAHEATSLLVGPARG